MINTLLGHLVYYAPVILMLIGGVTWLNKLSADIKTAQVDNIHLKERLDRIEESYNDELHRLRLEMNDQFNYQRQSLDKVYQFLIQKGHESI